MCGVDRDITFEYHIKKESGKWVVDEASARVLNNGVEKKWSIIDELEMDDEYDTREECVEAFHKATRVWSARGGA